MGSRTPAAYCGSMGPTGHGRRTQPSPSSPDMTERPVPGRARLAALAGVAAAAALVPALVIALGQAQAASQPGDGDTSMAPTASRIPMSTVAPEGPLPSLTNGGAVSGSVTVYGRGYGHGVGLSQYGARGRAVSGQRAEPILAHYYAGTTLGSISPSTAVRVLVLSGFAPSSSSPLVLHGRSGTWTMDGLPGTWPADAKLTVAPTTSAGVATWRMTVTSA